MDSDYLEESEMNVILSQMLQTALQSQEKVMIAYSMKYLSMVESYHHILGKDYNFISACGMNRRAFSYWFIHATKGYHSDASITLEEIFMVIEMLCSDFNRSLVHESAKSCQAVSGSTEQYVFISIRTSFLCHFLFDLWLAEVDKIFKVFGSFSRVGSSSISDRIASMTDKFLHKAMMPSAKVIAELKEMIQNQHYGADISFQQWKRLLIACPTLAEEVSRLPRNFHVDISHR